MNHNIIYSKTKIINKIKQQNLHQPKTKIIKKEKQL